MNWLGSIIAKRILPTDEVLDLGCGIMQPTGGRLAARIHVGLDSYPPYLTRIGEPTILAALPDAVTLPHGLPSKSFDVVLLLDIVEHLEKPQAMALIAGAERIARREVIVFTPDGFCPQVGWDAWGMGVNEGQAHHCGFTFYELTQMGYACERYANGTVQHGAITSVLGVKCVAEANPDWATMKRDRKRREPVEVVIQRWKESCRTLH